MTKQLFSLDELSPPRWVQTVEELDALPDESVVLAPVWDKRPEYAGHRHSSEVWQKFEDQEWWCVGESVEQSSEGYERFVGDPGEQVAITNNVARIGLPALVIFTGPEPGCNCPQHERSS